MSESIDIEALGVFQVFTGGGTGSGFLIDDCHLVTNCHVVAPYRSVAIELRNKRRVVGEVRRIHPKRDLAVVALASALEFDAQASDGAPAAASAPAVEAVGPRRFHVLDLAPAGALKAKQPVNIIGFPVGLPLSLTEGVVSNPKQLLDGQHYVQTDAAINPGNSGGPILDGERRIVAVTTCKLTAAESVGFGIPVADVRRFVAAFREQQGAFGVECPACEALIEQPVRYCDGCGTDLDELELGSYFDPPEAHPVVAFVERALARAHVDPVLARHGSQNWSFYSGSAPIKIWCCCSEHVCFSSPLVEPGKKALGDLFRFLLSPEHEPFAFDLNQNIIRLNLTIHMSDVFAREASDELTEWIGRFLATADRYDNALIERFGCQPAPETQLTFLKEAAG